MLLLSPQAWTDILIRTKQWKMVKENEMGGNLARTVCGRRKNEYSVLADKPGGKESHRRHNCKWQT
jgi:hypothetical protein